MYVYIQEMGNIPASLCVLDTHKLSLNIDIDIYVMDGKWLSTALIPCNIWLADQ